MRSLLEAQQNHDGARARLRGTVWETSAIALAIYRVCLAVSPAIGRSGITANFITLLSVVFAGGAAAAAASNDFALAAALVIMSGLCDLLDGVVARASGTVSRFGALLDSTMDRIADGLPLLGLVIAFADNKWIAAVPACAIVTSFTVSYVRARAEGLGVELPPLFMRRAERVLLLVLSLLLGELAIGSVRAPLLLAGLVVLTVMSAAATIGALREAHRIMSREASVPRRPPVDPRHATISPRT